MSDLDVPQSVIDGILDDPVSIYHSTSLDATERAVAIAGFVRGFRIVFFFNGACVAVAAVIAILFIKEFPLIRDDDEDQRASAKEWLKTKGKRS